MPFEWNREDSRRGEFAGCEAVESTKKYQTRSVVEVEVKMNISTAYDQC